MSPPGFGRLVHADWSRRPQGRWAAEAERTGAGWVARGPRPVRDQAAFLKDLLDGAEVRPTLAGFDFPLGLPEGYGIRTGFGGFRDALPAFGTGRWSRFFEVAEAAGEVGLLRPFYPSTAGGRTRRDLLEGHGVASIDALTRRCERGGSGRRAAGCLFWTLGGNQVGKAALDGWSHVIRPGLAAGARLWPFDGPLAELADRGGLSFCETYPADVYGALGAPFGRRESKRRLEDRRGKAGALLRWAEGAHVVLDPSLARAIDTGFPAPEGEDDGFDAVVGLFGMIAVTDGRRPDGLPDDGVARRWEGWILGRQS